MTPSEMLRKVQEARAEYRPVLRVARCCQCQCDLEADEVWRCKSCIKGESREAARFTPHKQVYRVGGEPWLLDLLDRKICATCGNNLIKLKSQHDPKKTFYSCEEDVSNHRWCVIDGKEPHHWEGM